MRAPVAGVWCGGESRRSNLVSRGRFSHRQVHEGKVNVLVLDDGAIRFVRPDGASFDGTLAEHTQPIAGCHELVEAHEEEGLHIDHQTAGDQVGRPGM